LDSTHGWQCRFVANKDNWVNLSKEEFIASEDVQRTAIKYFTKKNIERLFNSEILSSKSTAKDIAEAAAVGHLLGVSCEPNRSRLTACDYYRTHTVGTDTNGTSATEYAELGRSSIHD
jgi:hypothetical protein